MSDYLRRKATVVDIIAFMHIGILRYWCSGKRQQPCKECDEAVGHACELCTLDAAVRDILKLIEPYTSDGGAK